MDENKKLSLQVEVARCYERFWDKNQLSIDSKGKVFRTTIPRERPSQEVDFRNGKTKKGEKSGKVY